MTEEPKPTVVRVRDLADHVGESIRVEGWLANRRSSGGLHFLQIRDGSGTVQAVAKKNAIDAALFDALGSLSQESSLRVDGEVKADPRSPAGVELSVTSVDIVGPAEVYPISNKEHSTGFLMQHRHLWLRSSKQAATLRVRARIIKSIRDYFDNRGYVCMDAPMFTPAACEGTTTLFEVDYFGEPAYLTQSGQLYGEAGAMALGKIYVFGPTFRAEKSKTRKHLTEFWMVEPEIAWAELDDVMDVAEEFIETIVADVLADCRPELDVLERNIAELEAVKRPFPRETYHAAVARMQAAGHEFKAGDDFGAPDEEFLTKDHDKPLLVHRWPADIKAFYMKRDPENDALALAVDVIAPQGYGEIIGGSERASDLAFLEQQIEKHGLPKESFEWYLDLRRYGTVPHGGFGLGLERTVAWICGTQHIRECIAFPRMLYKIYP
jgi:asparaginyl-tRNA synthetase